MKVERAVAFLRARWSEDEARAVDELEDDGLVQRVMRECEAKRGVLAQAAMMPEPDKALSWMTLPYANHPDCDPSWVPEGRAV